jgi:tetraprenyl-beta-curcumene synthase
MLGTGRAQRRADDPAPLSIEQLHALAVTAARELTWGLPELGRETRRWARRAEQIPDRSLRSDALDAIERKRGHVAGAAFFSILPRERSPALLRTLATFQAIFDLLDKLHEGHPTEANGLTLHLALLDAIEGDRPLADYYGHHPCKEDGGYLPMLVEDCRSSCQSLPSYARLRPLLSKEVERARHVLTLHHLPGKERDAALQSWAEREFPNESGWAWFELCAAAGGQLAILVLLALAAEPEVSEEEVEAIWAAYWPAVPIVTTMADSFVDQAEDAINGQHVYISHYPDADRCAARVSELIDQANRALLELPNGHRHAVIMSCMTTFYLSKRGPRTAAMKRQRVQMVRAGGSLSRLLMPALAAWRFAYSQTSLYSA